MNKLFSPKHRYESSYGSNYRIMKLVSNSTYVGWFNGLSQTLKECFQFVEGLVYFKKLWVKDNDTVVCWSYDMWDDCTCCNYWQLTCHFLPCPPLFCHGHAFFFSLPRCSLFLSNRRITIVEFYILRIVSMYNLLNFVAWSNLSYFSFFSFEFQVLTTVM